MRLLDVTLKVLVFIMSAFFMLNGSQNLPRCTAENYLDRVTTIKPIQDIIVGYYKSWDLIYILPVTEITSLTYTTDSKQLVTSSIGKISFWDAQKFELLHSFDAHKYKAHIELSPDGNYLISSNEKSIKIWRINGHEIIRTPLCSSGNYLSFSPIHEQMAISDNHLLTIKNRESTQAKHLFQAHDLQSRIFFMTYAPNGNYLATIAEKSGNCELRLWDCQNYALILTRHVVPNSLQSMSFSPDSQRIAIAVPDALEIVDINTKKTVYNAAYKNLFSVRYIPHSFYLVLGFTELKLIIIDSQKYKLDQMLIGPSSYLTVAHNGKYLATSAASDSGVHIWQIPQELSDK